MSTPSSIIAHKYIFASVLAFGLNLIWEFWHSQFYLTYQGGEITSLILIRAAIVDSIIILILLIVADAFRLNCSVILITGGLLIAIIIELWALKTGRWAYSSLMPLIPFLNIGLTPTIQLAITGYLTMWTRGDSNPLPRQCE